MTQMQKFIKDYVLQDGFVFTFGPCVRCVRVKIREKQGYRMN